MATGVGAAIIEAFGGVRPVELYKAKVDDQQLAEFLHAKATALASAAKIAPGGR